MRCIYSVYNIYMFGTLLTPTNKNGIIDLSIRSILQILLALEIFLSQHCSVVGSPVQKQNSGWKICELGGIISSVRSL